MSLGRGKVPTYAAIYKWLKKSGFYKCRVGETDMEAGTRIHNTICKLKKWR